ncbi:MAG: hypothetical protein M3506_07530 [Chloroflexota bacterium]|nr:hypothetical protein [Chloroflexota bacterium]
MGANPNGGRRDWSNGASADLRAIYFGSNGTFSAPTLSAFLAGGVEVCAVVLAAPPAGSWAPAIWSLPFTGTPTFRTALPLLGGMPERGIVDIAREWGIPVFAARTLGAPAAVDAIRALKPDIICAACYPRRVPKAVLDLPPLGCVNVHPSLLPRNRGPAPLFWTFREGAGDTGVSVHIMSDEIDAGSMVKQAGLSVPDGITGEQMERRCAVLGGELLLRAVRGLAAGTTVPIPQETTRASYRGWPTDPDFEISAHWSARRAFNFIRGVSDWPQSPVIVADGERIAVGAVSGYDDDASLPRAFVVDGSELLALFSPGVLRISAWE